MKELMNELGFNPESSEDAKKAFIKNLIQAAAATSPAPTPIHVGAPMPKAETKKSQPTQLEFDFTKTDDTKKVS